MPITTTLGLLTKVSMSSADRGRRFFELLQAVAPDMVPRRYDVAEPIAHVFDPARIEHALALWSGPLFFWKTLARGGEGSYLAGASRNSMDVVCISVDRDDWDASRLIELMQRLAIEFRPEFAYVHRTFDEEVADRQRYKTRVMPFCQGLSAHEFQRGLPGVAWAMYFGEEFAKRIGVERLVAAPAYRVSRLGEHGVFVQVTESLRSFTSDYPRFHEASERVIQYLGEEVSRPH